MSFRGYRRPGPKRPPYRVGSRRYLVGLALAMGLPTVGATIVPLGGQAYADEPTPCHADTRTPRNYTHGSPITGLVSRKGYYYLDVELGPGCGLGADGLVHIVAHVHALEVLPKVGDMKDGYVPDGSHHAVYWLEFHGYADTGREYTLPGGRYGSRYVSTADHLDKYCHPNNASEPEVCQDAPGTSLLTLRYDGPDAFGLGDGKDARFRIANESGLIITDFAQMDIVASAEATAPIVG